MRLDNYQMGELDNMSLVSKSMAILTDVQEIAKNRVEKESNVLVRFELPFNSAFEEYFEKEGAEIKEQNPSYKELVFNDLMYSKIIEFSLGTKKTARTESLLQTAYREYRELVNDKVAVLKKEENANKLDLNGYIENDQVFNKIADLIEFIYIYRYNTRDTTKVLQYLNEIFIKKYGANFIQANMDVYQAIEMKIEKLKDITDKIKELETLIGSEDYKTIDFCVIFYWFYASGELKNLVYFMEKEKLPLIYRDHLAFLIMKRANIKSKNEKIIESTTKAKKVIKDILAKLNNRDLPVVSKKVLERLLFAGMDYFPDYFEPKVVKRIKDNVFNYIKLEKMKNA